MLTSAGPARSSMDTRLQGRRLMMTEMSTRLEMSGLTRNLDRVVITSSTAHRITHRLIFRLHPSCPRQVRSLEVDFKLFQMLCLEEKSDRQARIKHQPRSLPRVHLAATVSKSASLSSREDPSKAQLVAQTAARPTSRPF